MISSERLIPCFTPNLLEDTSAISKLPDGYSFAENVSVGDIYRLYSDCEPLDPGEWEYQRDHLRLYEAARFIDLAVQDTQSRTVGIGAIGLLYPSEPFAELYGFIVSPESQHRGIGKAIVDLRVQIATGYTPNVFIHKIAETNTLKSYYEEKHGFNDNGDGEPAMYKGRMPIFLG